MLRGARGGHGGQSKSHFPVGRVWELQQRVTPTWGPGGGGIRVQDSHTNLTQGGCKASLSVLYYCVCVCVYVCVHACACTYSVMSNSCDPMDCSPPGSSLHGILQARILEWITMPFSRGSPDPGIEPVLLASPVLLADSLLSHLKL